MPDFAMPDISTAVEGAKSLRGPMKYLHASTRLRKLLQDSRFSSLACSPQEAFTYTPHLAMGTILLASYQASLPASLRREQGHHRGDSGRQSVRIYSRDYVRGALQCQQGLIDRLAAGFRPLRPQGCGGQILLQRPAFFAFRGHPRKPVGALRSHRFQAGRRRVQHGYRISQRRSRCFGDSAPCSQGPCPQRSALLQWMPQLQGFFRGRCYVLGHPLGRG